MSLYNDLPFSMFRTLFVERHVKGLLNEVESYRLEALLRNDDREGARKALWHMGKLKREFMAEFDDRGSPPTPMPPKTCEIARFDPGDHYYTLGEKFNTLEEAIGHANGHGYSVSRVFRVTGSGENRASMIAAMTKPARQ